MPESQSVESTDHPGVVKTFPHGESKYGLAAFLVGPTGQVRRRYTGYR